MAVEGKGSASPALRPPSGSLPRLLPRALTCGGAGGARWRPWSSGPALPPASPRLASPPGPAPAARQLPLRARRSRRSSSASLRGSSGPRRLPPCPEAVSLEPRGCVLRFLRPPVLPKPGAEPGSWRGALPGVLPAGVTPWVPAPAALGAWPCSFWDVKGGMWIEHGKSPPAVCF